jgi:hypothetical protein
MSRDDLADLSDATVGRRKAPIARGTQCFAAHVATFSMRWRTDMAQMEEFSDKRHLPYQLQDKWIASGHR